MRGFFRLDIPAPPFPLGPLGTAGELVRVWYRDIGFRALGLRTSCEHAPG
jgi:hypothetical protein